MHARCAAFKPADLKALTSNPAAQSFKRLEAARVARLKKVGRGIVSTLKHADKEARELWLHELRDMATVTEDLLKPRAEQADHADQAEADQAAPADQAAHA